MRRALREAHSKRRGKGAKTADEHPGVAGTQNTPAELPDQAKLLPKLVDLRRGEDAGKQIRVSVQVLGGRVEHKVGSEVEGAGRDRRRHCAVHRQDRSGPMRLIGGLPDVDHVPRGIDEGLDPDHGGLALPQGPT